MFRKDLGVYLSIISHARTSNVSTMEALVGPATWFVGDGEARDYKAAKASNVVEGGKLCASRNAALRAAWKEKRVCLQLSDDLTKSQVAVRDGTKNVATAARFEGVVRMVLEGMDATNAMLGGVAPTANPFYANTIRPVHTGAFVVGDAIAVAPCDFFFDEKMSLKEDYDYTLQHIMGHGVVARRDDVLLTFLHRKNAGGAVEARTEALEQSSIAHLKKKWPGFIRDNPRRPNEILLKLPR